MNKRYKRGPKKWLSVVFWASLACSSCVNAAIPEFKQGISNAALSSRDGGLAAALRATMTYNPAIKGKQAELNAQQHGIASAKAGRYPSLNAQADNVSDSNGQATLRLDQPLWAFGKIDAGIDYATASFNAEKWGLLQVQRQLIEDTAAAYAKIDGIKQRALVAQTNIDEHQRLYQRIERRQKGQLASQADVRLAYSRLLQAKATLQQIQGELLVAHNELQALTQISVSTEGAVSPELAVLPCCSSIEQLAISNSADIRFKRLRMDVVRLDVKQEKLASTPTIYMRAEHDIGNINSNIDRTRAGLVIEGHFDGMGFVAKGRVNSAKSRLKAAQYDLDNVVNDVRRRVSTLMLNRAVQEELSASQKLSVEAIAATRESFLRQYKTGRKSWVEVLNTQREFTESRLQLAQIKNEGLILSLRLASLTGALDLAAGVEIDE